MNAEIRFALHNRRVRAEALRAFRRRKTGKLAAQLFGTFAVGLAFFYGGSGPVQRPASLTLPSATAPSISPSQPKAPLAQSVLVKTETASPTPAGLSDDELLAAFPPGSCYIAEVAGKKRLVFRSEEIRTRYFN